MWACWILGAVALSVGAFATFVSDNQAGTTAFVVVGGVLIFLAVAGRLPLAFELAGARMDASYLQDSAFEAGLDAGADLRRSDDADLTDSPAAESVPFSWTPTAIAWSRMTFSGPDTCRLSSTTYRQLDYWVRTGLITPVPQSEESPDTSWRSMFSFKDVVIVATVKELLEAGLSLQVIRQAVDELKRVPITSLHESVVVMGPRQSPLLTDLATAFSMVESGASVVIKPLESVIAGIIGKLEKRASHETDVSNE